MEFLICIGGGPPAMKTLENGVQIARSFGADIAVMYVDQHHRMAFSNSVAFGRQKLSEWELEHPGVKILREAREKLVEIGVIRQTESGLAERHVLRPDVEGAFENHFYGEDIHQIRLRLREGRLVDQIRKEVQIRNYDVTIIGGINQHGNTRRLIQFVDTSFIVIDQDMPPIYNLLFCSDISDTANRALMFGAKVAKALNTRMDILRVAKEETPEEARNAVTRAETLLRRGGIQHTVIIESGEIVERILKVADEEYAIVMGASQRSELMKFLLGSNPIKVIQRAKTHVIVVK